MDVDKSAEKEILNKLKAYPNPATDKVYIFIGDKHVSTKDVSIYDIVGNNYPLETKPYENDKLEINLNGMNSGMYIIKLKIGDQIEVFRIIKK